MSTLVECTGLNKNYGKVTALHDVNLTIESGHIIGLLGPNGSGKTTLIKILNGLLTPSSGTVLVKGKPIGIDSKKVISYLPDHTYLNMNQRVSEVISFFKTFYEDFDERRAYDMLAKLGINAKDRLKSMSKGTKEKVQLILVMSRRCRSCCQRLYFECDPDKLRYFRFDHHFHTFDRRYRKCLRSGAIHSEWSDPLNFLSRCDPRRTGQIG